MQSKSAIYTIKHLASGKLYVGSAKDFKRRFIEHRRDLKRGTHVNVKLQRAWNKYGADAFVFSVLESVPDQRDLIAREQFWIDSLNTAAAGYNIAVTAGSLLGFEHSPETRQKMSASHTGKKKTPEHVAKLVAALKGRKMTPEQCQKMRDAKLGKKRPAHSEETKRKMSEARLGMKFSDAHKANMARVRIGKKLPEATRQKMSASHKARFAPLPPP